MKYPPRRMKHGHRRRAGTSHEYQSWRAMMQRCHAKGHPSFARYGAAGVKVCPEWRSFVAFLRDMGPAPTPKHTLDRLRPGDYAPDNVRWATPKEQMATRRAWQTHCKRGHLRDETNIRVYRSGTWQCRVCKTDLQRIRRQSKKAAA